MPVHARVGTKGQLVIPADIRKQLGIRSGQRVRVEVQDGNIILKPVPDNILDLWQGRFAEGSDLMAALRADHEEEMRHDDRYCVRHERPAGVAEE